MMHIPDYHTQDKASHDGCEIVVLDRCTIPRVRHRGAPSACLEREGHPSVKPIIVADFADGEHIRLVTWMVPLVGVYVATPAARRFAKKMLEFCDQLDGKEARHGEPT